MTTQIECLEHFEAVTQFATANACLDKLNLRLARLEAMCGEHEVCILHYDFAPNSFLFQIKRPGVDEHGLVGGLIYSGPGLPLNGSAPTFTVSVEPTGHEHNWSIHT